MKDAEGVEGVDTTPTIGQSISFRSGPLAGRLIRCASRISRLARPGVRLAPLSPRPPHRRHTFVDHLAPALLPLGPP